MKYRKLQKTLINIFKRIMACLLLVAMAMGLSACYNTSDLSHSSSALLHANPSQQEQREAAIHAVNDAGVVVQHIGESMALVLDNHVIFHGSSINFNSAANNVLKSVTRLIFLEQPEVVHVATFASRQNPSAVALVLASERSKRVMGRLWGNGVNTRMLFSLGDQRYTMGKHRLIFGPSAYSGRTIITFRLHRDHWS